MLNGGRVQESPPFLQETSNTHTLTLTHTQAITQRPVNINVLRVSFVFTDEESD